MYMDLQDGPVLTSHLSPIIPPTTKHPLLLLSTTILFLVYLLMDELFLSKILFEYSLSYEQGLQQSRSSTLDHLFIFTAEVGTLGVGIVLGVMMLCCRDRLTFYCGLINFSAQLGISQFMKLAYHHERPFWANANITGVTCEKGFGHPSGHSAGPLFFFIILFLDYVLPAFPQLGVRCIVALLLGVLDLGIVFGRLYLGVHGIDQVVLGCLLALYSGVVYYCWAKEWVTYHIKNFNNYSQNRAMAVRICIVIMVVMVVLQLSTYALVESSFQMESLWLTNMLSSCGVVSPDYPMQKGLVGSSAMLASPALFLGLILINYVSPEHRLSLNQTSTPFVRHALLIQLPRLLISSLPLLLYFLQTGNQYVQSIILSLSLVSSVVIYAAVMPQLMQRCGWKIN